MHDSIVLGIDSPPDLLRRFINLPISFELGTGRVKVHIRTNDAMLESEFRCGLWSRFDRGISCTLVLDDNVPLIAMNLSIVDDPVTTSFLSSGAELHFDAKRASISGIYRPSARNQVVASIQNWIQQW